MAISTPALDISKAKEYEEVFLKTWGRQEIIFEEHRDGRATLNFITQNLSNQAKLNIFYGALSIAGELKDITGTPTLVQVSTKVDMEKFVKDFLDKLAKGLQEKGYGSLIRAEPASKAVVAR